MADETKTEPELVAEPSTSSTAPAGGQPGSRRGVLRWIAPVVLFVGATLKPSTAQAADDFLGADETGRCTPRP